MPPLVWAKRRTGRQLGSAIMVADSMQTLLCTYLSVILLAGLLLNATLVIAGVAVREGRAGVARRSVPGLRPDRQGSVRGRLLRHQDRNP